MAGPGLLWRGLGCLVEGLGILLVGIIFWMLMVYVISYFASKSQKR